MSWFKIPQWPGKVIEPRIGKVTISLRSRPTDSVYVAKKIWQELFRLYKANGGDLSNLYELLCDLRGLEDYLTKYKNKDLCLTWTYETWGNTHLTDEHWPEPGRWLIRWPAESDEITIERADSSKT